MNITKRIIPLIFTFFSILAFGQADFSYRITLEPFDIPELEGIHSFAHAQWDGKWIIIGGRLDGLHPRQPFRSFSASYNNTDILVVDPATKEVWKTSIETLPVDLKEQLQSTNMQFFQEGASLFIIGGYAFSESKGKHITFPFLTIVDLKGLVESTLDKENIASHFQQIHQETFAVTGGYLGKIADEFYLVGGHRFDGMYNPMGHASYTQTYTNAIRKFTLKNSNGLWSVDQQSEVLDPVHLHRRDYNLMPQVFPNEAFGYTLFSGVFQINDDLPFLYPVDITAKGYEARTGFNQYLSNYHSATAALYDEEQHRMHNLFFGGMSQFYYEEDTIVKDNKVPFVKTISRVSRNKDGLLEEVRLATEMPGYLGASAEMFLNEQLPMAAPDIVAISQIEADSFLLGYIVGGIESDVQHAFSFNNTEATTANATVFKVHLKKVELSTATKRPISGYHSFEMTTFPNPNNTMNFSMKVIAPEKGRIEVFVSDSSGRMLLNERRFNMLEGENTLELKLDKRIKGMIFITAVLNGKYAATSKLMLD